MPNHSRLMPGINAACGRLYVETESAAGKSRSGGGTVFGNHERRGTANRLIMIADKTKRDLQVNTIDTIVVADDHLTEPGLHPQEAQPMAVALEKAAVLEHYSGATVVAGVAAYDHVADESTEVIADVEKVQLVEALKAKERKGLSDLAARYQGRIAALETRLLWCKHPAQAILGLAGECDADLLIKPVSKHRLVTDYLHAPLDWAVMRQAGCPVLISKRPWPEEKVVLACVDAGNSAHDQLNERILKEAHRLSTVLAAPLHVVAVYSDLGQTVNNYQVAIDFEGLKADMKQRREQAIETFDSRLGLNATAHVLEGSPAKVIGVLAQELSATVAVVGTAARGGLAKFFVGNTAEDLIRHLPCDVVSVRDAD